MASPCPNHLNHNISAFPSPPVTPTNNDAEGLTPLHRRPWERPANAGQRLSSVRDMSPLLSSRQPSGPPLGIPATKKRFHTTQLVAAIISLLCLALAITAVADERVSWHLGRNNRQLIVLGFLLSIMNLNLSSVMPMLFLILEARFGPSTLQNYNGILLNQLFSPRLSLVWRLVLGLVMALPLGLSVAYKTFTGGESAMIMNVTASISNTSFYGMFAPPGLQLLGEKTGVSLFSNATLPFAVRSALVNGSEPPLPTQAQPYGFNILLLNNESAAILDIPQPSYVSSVQKLLASGESWNVSASVCATVATFNHSKTSDPEAYREFFALFCYAATQSSGAYTHATMMNDWSVVLLNHASPGDQSLQYIGLTPDPGIEHMPRCADFFPYAKLFDINRQSCHGTWSITRGGMQLVDGSCSGTILPSEKQEVIVHNRLFMGVWYMSSLVEFLGPFATTRNNSGWTGPYMATALAAMVWSRITVVNSPISMDKSFRAPKELALLTAQEAGLVYPVNDTAKHVRPTLRKSGLLYFVLATQPLLIIFIIGLKASAFHSMPMDRGFGLISILSGIDRDSLDILAGAALSGELVKRVKLVMRPIQDDRKGTVEYHVVPPPSPAPQMRNEVLAPKIVYH
ncbi:MAG: hypothetical protein L6R41_004841 [Letrouitia leprolyta]|nr:MAG: hypothetical protein L6R41_004841 [Letrouitia leprolyta]